MSSVVISGDTSGTVTLQAPAVAGTTTLTLPATSGTLVTTASGTAATATNLAGGVAGAIPYQSGSGATGFSAAGTAGQVLQSNGSSAPSWVTASAGALTFISSVTASNSATVSFTNIGSTYDSYMITFNRVIPATNSVQMRIRTSTNNGSTYDSGASDYKYAIISLASDATNYNTGSNASAFVLMNNPTITSTATSGGLNGTFNLFNPSSVSQKQYFWNTTHVDAGAALNLTYGSGVTAISADVDAIQFYMSSGNIASGTFRLYGISNS